MSHGHTHGDIPKYQPIIVRRDQSYTLHVVPEEFMSLPERLQKNEVAPEQAEKLIRQAENLLGDDHFYPALCHILVCLNSKKNSDNLESIQQLIDQIYRLFTSETGNAESPESTESQSQLTKFAEDLKNATKTSLTMSLESCHSDNSTNCYNLSITLSFMMEKIAASVLLLSNLNILNPNFNELFSQIDELASTNICVKALLKRDGYNYLRALIALSMVKNGNDAAKLVQNRMRGTELKIDQIIKIKMSLATLCQNSTTAIRIRNFLEEKIPALKDSPSGSNKKQQKPTPSPPGLDPDANKDIPGDSK